MFLYLFLLSPHFIALGSMNSIKPESTEEHVAEGTNINLTCKYEGAIDNIQWYRQYRRSRPEFLIYITEGNFIHPTVSDFSAHINKAEKRVALEISSAAVTDSAVYYCALRPTELTPVKTEEDSLEGSAVTLSYRYSTKATGISCENLSPVKDEVHSLEGSTVTLSYRYSRQADGTDHFFWYRQYQGKPPEFLWYISGLNFTRRAESLRPETKFSTKLSEEKHRVDLQISSAAVTDSALYYCAVKPTWKNTDQLLFGFNNSKDMLLHFFLLFSHFPE
ncbi:uncharacterized protein [Pempheris klunzingeri]|uniref:uncharacterized protein n=1 Tax=Pempheris klunzingeri TaxID=3127111 RepID=UPI00397EE5AE